MSKSQLLIRAARNRPAIVRNFHVSASRAWRQTQQQQQQRQKTSRANKQNEEQTDGSKLC